VKRVLASLLTLLVVLSGAVAGTPATGVTNPDGFRAAEPWHVSLWVKDLNGGPDRQTCGGALIAPQWVLTAAHCISDSAIAYARIGDDLDGKRLEVSFRVTHSRYNKETYINDIGLVVLGEPADATPIQLPPLQDGPLLQLESLSVMGWGEDQNGIAPGTLAFARQQDLTSQADKFFDVFNPELQIAAGRYIERERVYSGACRGDSGGPLVATFGATQVLVGVVSYGSTDCNSARPTVYSRVSGYLDFIDEALRDVVVPGTPGS
jgi:secreted trypsin-like serine protease